MFQDQTKAAVAGLSPLSVLLNQGGERLMVMQSWMLLSGALMQSLVFSQSMFRHMSAKSSKLPPQPSAYIRRPR